MVNYYVEALLEAIVFCISEGFSEEYVMDLDVYGFGQVYKFIRRIDARRQINSAGLYRTASNANGKQFKEYIGVLDAWLPEQERETAQKGTQSDFDKLVSSGKL